MTFKYIFYIPNFRKHQEVTKLWIKTPIRHCCPWLIPDPVTNIDVKQNKSVEMNLRI